MANYKDVFAGLVKIESSDFLKYLDASGSGKLVFAHITADSANSSAGYFIWANGVEYKIATHEEYVALLARVEDVSLSALRDVSISSLLPANNSTNIVITESSLGGTTSSSINIKGDDYVKIVGTLNNIGLSTIIGDISIATQDVSGLATAKAVHDYVESKLGDIANALTFEGGSLELRARLAATDLTPQNVGDTFVINVPNPSEGQPGYNGKDNFTWDGSTYALEMGDMVIITEVTSGAVSKITVVERNLDGAVTCASTLVQNNLVIGDGNQVAKTSHLNITDVSVAVDLARTAAQDVLIHTATPNWVEVLRSETDSSVIDLSVNILKGDVSTATSDASGLATAYDVQEYVKGQLADTSFILNSSTPNYVQTSQNVTADGHHISSSVGVVVKTLSDVSTDENAKALADARDVYNELVAVEETAAAAMTAMADTLGLDSDFGVSWSASTGIPEDYTYKQAIEQLALNASTMDTSIEEADKVVVRLTQENGAIDASLATIIINGSTFKRDLGGASLETTIYGSQILVGGVDPVWADTSIAKAIHDLSTALHDFTIEGDEPLAARAHGGFVSVSTNETQEGTYKLDASVQLAEDVPNASLPAGYTSDPSTGLATDKYVRDYVAYALSWLVINDLPSE